MAKIWRVRVGIPREGGHVLDEFSTLMGRLAAEDAANYYKSLGLDCEIEASHTTAKVISKGKVRAERTTIKMVNRGHASDEYLLYKIGSWSIVANRPVLLPESDVADKLAQVIMRMLKKEGK